MDHLIAFDETIVTYLRDDPNNTIKVFETAVLEIFKSVIFDESNPDMEENPNITKESSENYKIKGSSYYSASKAASDLLVEAAGRTYGLPYLITRTCNNFGEHQFKEKFLPTIAKEMFNSMFLNSFAIYT